LQRYVFIFIISRENPYFGVGKSLFFKKEGKYPIYHHFLAAKLIKIIETNKFFSNYFCIYIFFCIFADENSKIRNYKNIKYGL